VVLCLEQSRMAAAESLVVFVDVYIYRKRQPTRGEASCQSSVVWGICHDEGQCLGEVVGPSRGSGNRVRPGKEEANGGERRTLVVRCRGDGRWRRRGRPPIGSQLGHVKQSRRG
jgi:hypothetical protein